MPFSLADLLSPRGRLSRRLFCICLLAYIVLSYAVGYLGNLLVKLHPTMGMLITLILWLPLIAAMVCQVVRRYHDFSASGWIPGGYLLAAFVFSLLSSPNMPFVGDAQTAATIEIINVGLQVVGLLLIVFIPALIPAERGANRYGEPTNGNGWRKAS